MDRPHSLQLALVIHLSLIVAAAALPAAAAAASGDFFWVRVLDPAVASNRVNDCARGPDGSVYLCGAQGPSDVCDIWVAKYTPDGSPAWSQTWQGPDGFNDVAHGIAVDGDGNAYVCGSTARLTGASDAVVVKYDAGGVLRWASVYNPFGRPGGADAIGLDSDGRVYVVGWADTSASSVDAYTARFRRSNGSRVWTSWYSTPENDGTWALAVTDSGTTYAAGSTGDTPQTTQALLVKTTAAGHRAWARRWDGPEGREDDWEAVALGRSGNVYVAGDSDYHDDSDMAVAKYSKKGKRLWSRTWTSGGTGRDFSEGLAADRQGNAWVAGSSEMAGGSTIGALFKWSPSGERLFADTVGSSTMPARFATITVDAGGNAYAGGRIDVGGASGSDIMVAKYTAAGTRSWLTRFGYAAEDDRTLKVVRGDATSVYAIGRLDAGRFSALAKIER